MRAPSKSTGVAVGTTADESAIHTRVASRWIPAAPFHRSKKRLRPQESQSLSWNDPQAWWRAVCGGTRAAASLRDKGYSTVGQLFTISTSTAKVNSDETMMKCPEEEENVRRPCDGSRAAAVRRQLANGKTSRGDLVHQVVKDDDLAAKISSLFRMLMSAFEELRVSAWKRGQGRFT